MSSKILVIVESPTKATKIAEYLKDQKDEYIVKASLGHITELSKKNMGIDIQNNFTPHYTLMADKIQLVNDLMKTAQACDFIILFSDPDREGEQISYMLSKRLYLEDINKPFKRMTVNRIDKKSILNALNNMRDIDMNLVNSQIARSILDRIIGFTASPFLMNVYKSNKLSAGRVQSPLARIIVDREKEIESFVPETFYTIQVSLSKDNKIGFLTKYANKLTNETTAKDMKDILAKKNIKYIVSSFIKDEEKKNPCAPLITSTLQQKMSKLYNMPSDVCMKYAQSLYENGYVSYIRTDSVRVSDESIVEVREWLKNNKHTIPIKANVYYNKDSSTQDAHEAIIPLDINLLPDENYAILDPKEKLVYKEIWKTFVSSQMNPAIYSTVKIAAHVEGYENALVKASAKTIKEFGYLSIAELEIDNTIIDIPDLLVGDILFHFGPKPVKLEKKSTQPNARYTESHLIFSIKKLGIGRPSSYSDLISKISTREYVEKKGNNNNIFHATELGKQVVDTLSKYFSFMDYDYTAKMENQLDLIEQGKLDYIAMLKEFYSIYKQELDKAYLDHGGTLCEKCKNPMRTITTKTGTKFMGCTSYPRCNFVKQLENI